MGFYDAATGIGRGLFDAFSGGSGPKPQSAAETIRQQELANNYNINSPFGSRTFTKTPDGRTTLNINETDSQRGIRESQERLAQSLYGSRAPSIADFEGISNKVIDQIYNRGMERLDPLQQRNMRRREIDLANRGLGMNSDAYRTSMRDLNQAQQDERRALLSQAILSGISEAKDLTRLGEAQRARRFAEAGSATGGINAQLFGNVAPINTAAIQQGVDALNQQQYQADQARRTQLLSGIIGAGAMAMSDERLKEDIKYLGTSPQGYKKYSFKYKSDPSKTYQGAMAQDLQKIKPEAVIVKDGYLAVDYSLLDIEFKEIN
tara:strand:+ start:569 stop:1528 length:960 start_codon:yes stop_codon:yes gene_type:complete